jgi:hypothetical protein
VVSSLAPVTSAGGGKAAEVPWVVCARGGAKQGSRMPSSFGLLVGSQNISLYRKKNVRSAHPLPCSHRRHLASWIKEVVNDLEKKERTVLKPNEA